MITVRKEVEGDAQRIAEIYVETWRTTYAGTLPDRVLVGMSSERQAMSWGRSIRQGGELIYVAEDAKAGVIAVGSGGANRTKSSVFTGEVYTLYVHPDHQNQGIGERLLRRLFQALLEAGMGSAVIWVLAPNPSRFFYERIGGKRVGDRHEELWGTTLKEIAYGWPDLSAAAIASRRPQG
jgi:ribosomal protein S18 acetylase RimI-like enzyme